MEHVLHATWQDQGVFMYSLNSYLPTQ